MTVLNLHAFFAYDVPADMLWESILQSLNKSCMIGIKVNKAKKARILSDWIDELVQDSRWEEIKQCMETEYFACWI